MLPTLSGYGLAALSGAEAMALTQVSAQDAARNEVRQVDFNQHFLALNREILRRQEGQWKARYLKTLRTALYLKNHLGIYVDQKRKNGFGFQFFQAGQDPIYEMNLIEFYHRDVSSQLVTADPKIEAVPLVVDSTKRRRAVRGMNLLNEHTAQIAFTQENIQRLVSEGQVTGQWTIENFFDPNSRDGVEWSEQWELIQEAAQPYIECSACYQTFAPQDVGSNQVCPYCQGPLVAVEVPPVTIQKLQSADYDKAGEYVARPLSLWAQRFSLTTGPRLSPWRYIERDIPREHAEALFGDEVTREAADDWRDEYLHGERILRRAEAYASGQDQLEQDDAILLQEFYYEPECLLFHACERDTEMPGAERGARLPENARVPEQYQGGNIIPAGVRWNECFPDGLCLTTLAGTNKLLFSRGESHRERCTDGLFNVAIGEAIGRGNDAAAEFQRQATVVQSMMYQHVRETARPVLFISDRVALNPAALQRRVVPVPHAILADKQVGQLMDVLQMPQMSQAAPYLFEQLKQGLQRATGSFTGSPLMYGQDNNTATGIQIASAKQAGLHVPYLANFAQFKRAVLTRGAEIKIKFYGEKRLLTALDARSNSRIPRELLMADLRGHEWLWNIRPGSINVDTPMERQLRLDGALNAAALAEKMGKLTPDVQRQINTAYDVDLFNEHLDQRIDRCLDALDLMHEAYQIGERMPLALYSLAPVDPYEQGAEARLNYWRGLLADDDGYLLPIEIRQAIHLHIQANIAAIQIEGAVLQEAAAAGVGLLQLDVQGVNPINQGGGGAAAFASGENNAEKESGTTNNGTANSNRPARTGGSVGGGRASNAGRGRSGHGGIDPASQFGFPSQPGFGGAVGAGLFGLPRKAA